MEINSFNGMGIIEDPKILIVENESKIQKIITTVLKSNGLRSSSVKTLSEAQKKLEKSNFDIILLDLDMPDGSGFSLIQKAIESTPISIVVVIAELNNLDAAIRAIRAGAYDFITKPFSILQLQEHLGMAIDEWKSIAFTKKYQRYLETLVNEKEAELHSRDEDLDRVKDLIVKTLVNVLNLHYPETEAHCTRVVIMSLRLASFLGIEEEVVLKNLEWGAYLHDIGKIGVPESILKKADSLSTDEWLIMKKHPLWGYSILENIDFLQGASEIVLYHHEWWNGTGYPLGLNKKQIPKIARLFSIVDSFDAMVNDRPYRKAFTYHQALEELQLFRDIQFDPEMLDIFTTNFEYIVDSLPRDEVSLPKSEEEDKKNGTAA